MKALQLIFTLFLLLFVSQAALKNEEYLAEEKQGTWTNTIEAQNEYSQLPAQYYLCGFSFQEEIFSIELRNCKCGKYWYRWRYSYGCDLCPNQFRSRTAGLKTYFCRYNKWSDQIEKVVTSGSRNAGNWKDKLMCPIGYYASGFTAKFGTLHSKPLGFNGLLLTCTTADLKNSQIVQDNRNGHAQHYDVKNGSFISSFKIKYIEGSYLSGVAFYAEGLPIISSIKINYEISAGFDDYPVTIDSQIISNCDKNTAHKKVGFSKSYETTGQWNSNNPELKGYQILSTVVMSPPSLVNNKSGGMNGLYKSTTGVFGFENLVKTVIDSSQEILVFVSGNTQTKISTILQEQKGSIPYTAILTLTNKNTGDFIMNYTASGTWVGVTTSSVRTDIFSAPANCITQTPDEQPAKTNLRN